MPNYQINLEATNDRFQYDEEKICQIIETMLSKEKISEALVNIIFVGDKLITELNRKYLNKNSTTDVISFVLEKDMEKKSFEGEVYANLEQVKRQALEYKIPLLEEFFRIVIHGVLHLVGYNDQSSSDKKKMTNKEDYYLSFV